MKVIGVIGRKGSGKNALAAAIQDAYEGGVTELAYAGPLKEAARAIFLLNDRQLHGDMKEEIDPRWGLTPRELLQRLGTEVGREIDEQVWIKSLNLRAREAWRMTGRPVVVTDVRYANEADAIRAMRGLLVRVERSAGQQLELFGGHTSETEMDHIIPEITIVNDGKLSDLDAAAKWVLECLAARNWASLQKRRFVCSEA